MDNRYEIAEQNGMSREFADWFFDTKKAGCGNVWFMMMAAMWEGWQGRAAMLQGKSAGNSPVVPDGWQLVPKEPTAAMNKAGWDAMNEHDAINPTYRAMLAAAPQQENV
ncbi:hypothetical protein [Citrobacter portucalensis]|uniref:hypothetical protein n=1 Tax=Citrobacter portucalensis TaxID=1639133 RepID=UPI0023AFABD0|nr:hypothetical protein [Citrobacter portucalensis]